MIIIIHVYSLNIPWLHEEPWKSQLKHMNKSWIAYIYQQANNCPKNVFKFQYKTLSEFNFLNFKCISNEVRSMIKNK